MQAACLRHAEIPHTSALYLDFLYHYDRVARFYAGESTRAEYPAERRSKMVKVLRAQNGDSPALDLLAREGTAAVVTGQQVGLFSGPAYTLYKALTAARLAAEMTAKGTPAVPVFWLATEDHDLAEVNHAWIYGKDALPLKLEVNGTGTRDRPVGGIAFDHWPVDKLLRVIEDLPFGAEVGAWVEASYRPGVTLGSAFRDLLKQMVQSLGILFLDPMAPAVRQIAAPLLRDAVAAAPGLVARLLERNGELTAAGYHAQVHVEDNTSLFFVLDGGRRIPLRRQNGVYSGAERKLSSEELADRAESLSPNALLRPVLQDYLLPTATYVGGPAELAYLAQSEVLYRELLGGMPHPAPRTGFTILDSRCGKLLDRYGLRVQDAFHGEGALRAHIASRLVPGELRGQLESARQEMAALLDRVENAVSGFDASLAKSTAKSRAKMAYQFDRIESRVARESLHRDERAERDADYLSNLLFPQKHLQERFYSIIPLLAQHGPGLVQDLYRHVHPGCPDHVVVRA